MSQRIVVVNSDGAEQAFGTAGSNGQAPNAATEVVLVNSDGTEQTVVSAGSTSPIPASYAQVVVVNSAGVEQTIGTVGSTSPIPAKFVQGVMVDESGSEVTVTSSGGVTPIPAKFRRLLTVNSDGTYQPFTVGTPVSLTLSGNEITDAVRAAALSGDGLAAEGSMGVWEATTNLVTNGGLETNDTGWTDVSATGSRVTSQAKFGSASLEVVTGNATANEGCYHNFTATVAVYTVSAWVRGTGGTVRMAVRDNAGGSAQTGAAVTLTTTWQRISLTTTNLTAATWRCYVETDSQQNITFQVDGVQAEQQPLATPYVETNGSTASRSAADISLPVSGLLDETQGWLAFRIRHPWAHTSEPYQFPNLFNWADDGNNNLALYYELSGNLLYGDRNLAGAGNSRTAAASWSAGDSKTIVFAWTATALLLSVDGGAFASTANSSIPTISSGTALLLRDRVSAVLQPDADLFWFACGLGTLTNADAAAIHAWGNSDPPPGLFPTAADLTLIWRAIDSTARKYA